jgi:hypothetical protein
MSKNNKVPMAGTTWGKWLVIGESARRNTSGSVFWVCRCECGAEHEVLGKQLRSGKNMGCPNCRWTAAERNRQRLQFTTHGMSKSPTYRSWYTMHRRCSEAKFKDFPYYGGRGIQVCERWNSFENFLADMGMRPPGQTLDRKNCDGNYEPGNCRWATHRTQMNNTRRNRYLTYAGKTMSLSEWAREIGIPPPRLSARLRLLHWPLGKALGFEGGP